MNPLELFIFSKYKYRYSDEFAEQEFNFIFHKETEEDQITRLVQALKLSPDVVPHLGNHLIMKSLVLCKGPRLKLKIKSKTIYKSNSFIYVYCVPSLRVKSECTLYLDSKDIPGIPIQIKAGDRNVLVTLLNAARAREELNHVSDCNRLLRLGLSDIQVLTKDTTPRQKRKHNNKTCASCNAAKDSHSRRCLDCNILYCKTCKKKMMIKNAKKTWTCRKCPDVSKPSPPPTTKNPVKEALRKYYEDVNENKSEQDLDKILKAYVLLHTLYRKKK